MNLPGVLNDKNMDPSFHRYLVAKYPRGLVYSVLGVIICSVRSAWARTSIFFSHSPFPSRYSLLGIVISHPFTLAIAAPPHFLNSIYKGTVRAHSTLRFSSTDYTARNPNANVLKSNFLAHHHLVGSSTSSLRILSSTLAQTLSRSSPSLLGTLCTIDQNQDERQGTPTSCQPLLLDLLQGCRLRYVIPHSRPAPLLLFQPEVLTECPLRYPRLLWQLLLLPELSCLETASIIQSWPCLVAMQNVLYRPRPHYHRSRPTAPI